MKHYQIPYPRHHYMNYEALVSIHRCEGNGHFIIKKLYIEVVKLNSI